MLVNRQAETGGVSCQIRRVMGPSSSLCVNGLKGSDCVHGCASEPIRKSPPLASLNLIT